MTLSKGEKRLAVAAVAVVLIVGLVWIAGSAISKIELEQQIDSFDDFKWQHAITYQQGESIRCNSEEDESLVDGEGWQYYAGFDWVGTMNVVVEDSWLFDNVEEACSSIGKAPDGHYEETSDGPALLVKVRIENVDAIPSPHNGIDGYRISVLSGPSEWVYFDGASKAHGEKEYCQYSLSPGDTKEYHLCCVLDDDIDLDDLCINIGDHRDYPEKITVTLRPQDMRGGGAS